MRRLIAPRRDALARDAIPGGWGRPMTARPWRILGRRLESLGGRLVFVVCAAIAATAGATLALAAFLWSHEMETLHRAQFTEAISEIHDRISHDKATFDDRLRHFHFHDFAPQPHPWPRGRNEDEGLRAQLVAEFGPGSDPHVVRIDNRARCIQPLSLHLHEYLPQFGCWYVRFTYPQGQTYALEIDRSTVRNYDMAFFEPIYLAVIAIESVLLAVIISRLTLAPLRRLSEASQAFALSLDPALVPETGPREIRMALRTFNVMQQRVREGFTARTNLLASISHDLQTPLTRIRIRLEQVEDPPLRERLLADLGITLNLIRSGLELAASGDSRENWAVVDLGAFLDSIATDAQESGEELSYQASPTLRARVKPHALSRALQNLCDNAKHHAGPACLRAEQAPDEIRILVEDRGPGLPEDRLEAVFAPFARGPGRREGTGLGLAIARAQAATFGARITLENRRSGGLRATLAIPRMETA